MTVYYNVVLPQEQPVFDGYAFIVGIGAVSRRPGADHPGALGDGRDELRPRAAPDSDVFRRWEVAGAAHSGWEGQEYRRPLSDSRLRRGTGLQLHEADVQQWVLAGFKVPSRVEFRDSLPHNASGKVLKHVLASPDSASDFIEE